MISIAALFCAIALLASSCIDPEPGEISIRATKEGRQQGCVVQLYNSKGKQIREEFTDQKGLLYLKDLPPSNYTVKFLDNEGNPYPAEKQVNVTAGDSQIIDVELTEAPPVVTE
jgi:hypothetical protein